MDEITFNHVYVCPFVWVCEYVACVCWVPAENRDIGPPGVAGSCEPSGMCSGNKIQILFKSNNALLTAEAPLQPQKMIS